MSHRPVSLVDVHCGYPGRGLVLPGAVLHVPAGGKLALLGANGSGKSTLLRCLSEEKVAERVDHYLDLLALRHLADRPTHHLPYGERKRVAIAGEYSMRPCVPALRAGPGRAHAGLDPQAVRETPAALDRLHADRTTLVVATHDVALALALAWAWADNIAVVVDGQVRHGDPVDVLEGTELVARARLERPWVLAVAERLHRLGLLAPDVRPRTEADLVAALDSLGGAPAAS